MFTSANCETPVPTILPVTFIGCEKSNSSFVPSHKIVAFVELLTASCIVIPAPSAVEEVSPEPKLRVIFLSSTSRVAVLIVVLVPLTVRLPVTVKLPAADILVEVISSEVSVPLTVALLNVTLSEVPTAWPILI